MADEIIKELWQVKDGIANEYNYETKTFLALLGQEKQVTSKADMGTFLLEDDCEAWVHGPVYRDIYNRYSSYRFDPIEGV